MSKKITIELTDEQIKIILDYEKELIRSDYYFDVVDEILDTVKEQIR